MRNSRAVRRHPLWRGLLILAVTGFATAVGVVASAAPSEGQIVGAGSANAIPDSYIVVLKTGVAADVSTKSRALAAQYNAQLKHTYAAAIHGFAATMSAAKARQLAAHSDVAYVEQNQKIHLNDTQSNPPSWGLDRVDQRPLPVDNAYSYSTTASNVHAYVIDTGIHMTHNDFGGRASTGFDAITPGGTADDCYGHGTHVAGTIGGTSYGVAKGVSLVAVRVLDCSGSGSTAEVVAGVDWVAAHAIKPAVANMSLGGGQDPAIDSAVQSAINDGIVFSVSAGNADADACGQSPADVSSAITVGATDINDNRASFSNFGSCVDLFAPGVDITSSWNTSNSATRVLSGTSMAAPHVTGAAALVLAANPTWTPAQVSANLTGNATPYSVVHRGSNSPNLLLYTGSAAVPPPPANDFDISMPSTGAVAQGYHSSAIISTSITLGGSQTVNLTASSLPTGVTVGFSSSSISTGNTSTATFNASASTVPGDYKIAITLTGTSTTHAVSYTLKVSDNKGTYYQLAPSRILDTRIGVGAPAARLGPNSTISLQVTGQGGVPASGVSAVVMNVTAVNASAASYVTVYPSGVALPNASSLNVVSGFTGANSVTVAVGADGKVNIYNHVGSVDMLADVVGFYAADASVAPAMGTNGGEYEPIIPGRLFDSRDALFGTPGKLPGGGPGIQVGADFGPDINPHIRAFVVNVTAVDPSWAGYLTTWNGNDPRPNTSTLNFKGGEGAVPNMAVVPTGLCCGPGGTALYPSIGVFVSADSHIIVDIMGFVDDGTLGGLRFAPQTPVRIADTRIGQGAGTLGEGVTATITAPGAVAPAGTQGLALNVTAVLPTKPTFVSVWPSGFDGVDRPTVSNLNPVPGQTEPNSVYTLIGPTMAFNVYNNAGAVNILADVVGRFWDPASVGSASAGQQSALSGQQSALSGQQSALSGKQPWTVRGSKAVRIS